MRIAPGTADARSSEAAFRLGISQLRRLMNILIAYDGSGCAESAIDDLDRAGLQEKGSAHVISVAEVWLPPPDSIDNPVEKAPVYIEEIVRHHRAKGERVLAEASIHVKHAEARVRTALPGWTVTSSATYGSPAWEILAAADELSSDLIVVGSQGQSGLSRFLLGSISQKVLTEAHCSVRIARGKNLADSVSGAARIILGFDGSKGATAAVDAVAARDWPESTEVRLVTATELVTPIAITRFVPPVVRMVEEVNLAEQHWVEQLADTAVTKLRGSGLEASLRVRAGNPKQILVEEAEAWGADCIFVGANAYGSRLERVLLGSTSAAVAARAYCSVEAVRVRVPAPPVSNGKSASAP